MKNHLYLILGALALAGLVSCSRTLEQEDVSPLYNPKTNEVVTNLVFNVAGVDKATTRQAEAVVQEGSFTFRGIDNARLFTYTNAGQEGEIVVSEQTAAKEFNLDEVAAPGTLSKETSRRVLEMSLPLNTNQLLFYGKAVVGTMPAKASNPQNVTSKDYFGHLDAFHIDIEQGLTVVKLGQRLSDVTRFYTVEKLFSGVLSIIMATKFGPTAAVIASAVPDEDFNPYKFDVSHDEIDGLSWESYADFRISGSPMHPEDGAPLYPLEEKLGNAYVQMTTIKSSAGELRAASAEALTRTVQDLWTVMNEIRFAEPINREEAVAKYMAQQIFENISNFFSFSSIGEAGGPISGVRFATNITTKFNDARDQLPSENYFDGVTSSAWPTAAELQAIANMELNKFPFIFNLPRGATHMAFDDTRNIFYYPDAFNTSDMGDGAPSAGGAFNAKSYFFPAELIYFGNSPIRATNQDKKVSDYPNGVTNWINDSWTGWTDEAVKASTRAVAMRYNINYGTALLETKVAISPDDNGYIYDNNKAVQAARLGVSVDDPLVANEENRAIQVTDESFLLTGIIIGDQKTQVGWDFLPVPGSDTGFIFDKAIDNPAIPLTNGSAANYTMVFDNFIGTLSNGLWTPGVQDVVYVALEFQNNTGMDFYGNYNIIRNQGYFYLIGALNPTSAKNWSNFAYPDRSDYIIPPYASDGTSLIKAEPTTQGEGENVQTISARRVFMQDFVTRAKFTIGPNSLRSAYLTVPDLRSGSMTLGLSVDLKWEEGLNFEVLLGGE